MIVFTSTELALIAYALGVYRGGAQHGRLPMPDGGVDTLDSIIEKVVTLSREVAVEGSPSLEVLVGQLAAKPRGGA